MPTMRLSEAKIKAIKLPVKPRQEDYWDEFLPGFGMRVSYAGTKAWLVIVRVLEAGVWKQTRISLGKYPLMTLPDARERAKEVHMIAQSGKDPRRLNKQKQRHAEEESKKTFGVIRDRFLADCQELRTVNEYSRVLKSDSFTSWENFPLAEITKKDIIMLLDGIVKRGSATMANRTLAYLRSMMNWAVSQTIIESAPTEGVRAPLKEKARDRWLNENEIRIIWKALDAAGAHAQLFKFLLVTAQRKEEAGSMSRNELKGMDGKLPLWEIPRERVKMDRPHLVPLSPQAIEIINSIPDMGKIIFTFNGEKPLNGFSAAKKRVDDRIQEILKEDPGSLDIPDWRLHDLRRSAVTHMAELGIPRDIVEQVINHQSGTRGGIAKIYNRSTLLDERRAALRVWGEYLGKIIKKEHTEDELNSLRKTLRKKYHSLLREND